MRVLFISRLFYPSIGGVEKVMLEYAKRLVQKGHRVDVITTKKNIFNRETYLEKDEIDGIHIHRISALNTQKMSFYMGEKILFVLKVFKSADIVHIHDFRLLFLTSLIFKIILKKPLFFESYGMLFHTKKFNFLKKIIYNLFILPALLIPDKIIAISRHDYNLICDSWLKQIRKKVFILAGGVDYKKFFKIKKNIKSGRLLYLGRIVPNKGLDLLFITLSKISMLDYQLRIIGSGDERYLRKLQVLTKELKIDDRIQWLSFCCDEKRDEELSKAQFLLVPSKYESFGLVLLEGMSTGTVPIVNNIDTFQDVIDDFHNGFILNFNFPNESAQSLKELINKRVEEIELIGLSAQQKAKMFDWGIRVNKLEKSYRQLVDNK